MHDVVFEGFIYSNLEMEKRRVNRSGYPSQNEKTGFPIFVSIFEILFLTLTDDAREGKMIFKKC